MEHELIAGPAPASARPTIWLVIGLAFAVALAIFAHYSPILAGIGALIGAVIWRRARWVAITMAAVAGYAVALLLLYAQTTPF